MPSGSFTWDDLSHLTSQTAGGVTESYGYDAGGVRVWSQMGAGGRTFYLFDGDLLLGEVQANGTVSAAYTWGASGLVSERLVGQSKSLWYAFGPQGETRQLTDGTGTVVDSYLYTAYGAPLGGTGTDPNPFQYGGQVGYYTDGNGVGTVLCGARRYDPFLGRWLSRDPIGYAGGENLYAYCDGDPIDDTDSSGFDPRKKQGLLDRIGDRIIGFVTWASTPFRWAANKAFDGLMATSTYGMKMDPNAPTWQRPYLDRGCPETQQINGRYSVAGHAINRYIRNTGGQICIVVVCGMLARAGGTAPEWLRGVVSEEDFLNAAEKYLGPGYREVSPGRFLSADRLRQVRFGEHEIGEIPLHGHFEIYEGGRVIENARIIIRPE